MMGFPSCSLIVSWRTRPGGRLAPGALPAGPRAWVAVLAEDTGQGAKGSAAHGPVTLGQWPLPPPHPERGSKCTPFDPPGAPARGTPHVGWAPDPRKVEMEESWVVRAVST